MCYAIALGGKIALRKQLLSDCKLNTMLHQKTAGGAAKRVKVLETQDQTHTRSRT